MKKVLLASTALVMSAGVAAADISVGGDGRMGVTDPFGGNTDQFTSRIRIIFSASGETDGGLAFGGSIRADNADNDVTAIVDQNGNGPGDPGFDLTTASLAPSRGGVSGGAGSVFIEGGFGKLSMGDVDGAAKAAVGHVSGVGLTGIGDRNESTYIANAQFPTLSSDPSVLYEYSAGDFAVYVSASNTADAFAQKINDPAFALGGSYAFGNFSVALGYEDNGQGTDHIIGGVTAGFGDFTLKAIYGTASGNIDGDQYAISGDYTFGVTTVTAFYTDDSELAGSEAYGIGAAYDLGGGASLKAGYVKDETQDDQAYDFGVSFTF